MRMRYLRMVSALLGLGALLGMMAGEARANVTPNPLFSDGAVLQRGIRVPVWGTANEGEKVAVNFQNQVAITTAKNGQWQVMLKPLREGGPYSMTIVGNNTVTITNILVGEVWVCSGQSNMEFSLSGAANATEAIAASTDPMLRLFTVKKAISDEPLHTLTGSWAEAKPETVPSFSAVGYFFGRDLRKALKVPVGVIHTSWGGTPAEAWTSREMLDGDSALHNILDNYAKRREQYLRDMATYPTAVAQAKADGKPAPKPPYNPADMNRPSGLFNAMIMPLVPYAIKGALWYQGESNAGRAYEYRTLLPTMIRSWRQAWGEGDFAFYIVQLAPFVPTPDHRVNPDQHESAWAELREAQRLTTLSVPNTGMAVITDVGDEKDIHPTRKEPVGHRLALAALGLTYHEKVVASGPTLDSVQIKGNQIVLKFKNTGGGLVAQGGALTGFAISGADHKFVNAEAQIKGDTVIVSSPQVPKPVGVRFGWADYPVVNLYNKAGLPASPFRTDDFPWATQPK